MNDGGRQPEQVRSRGGHDLTSQTRRWVAAGLITEQQATAIHDYEHERAGPRSLLLAEVLGYLGGALVVAAVVAVLANRWDTIGLTGRLAVLGVATAVGIVGGAAARRRRGASSDRLTSVLWLASVAGVAGFTATLVGDQGLDIAEDAIGIVTAATASVVAAALYALHRRALQLVVVGTATTALVGAVVSSVVPDSTTATGIALMAVGVAWIVQSLKPVLVPSWSGFLVGGIVAWVGSGLLADRFPALGLGLGAAGAIAILVLSVQTRDLLQLGIGALGLFATLPRLAVVLFGGSVGGPLALLLTGGLVLLVALMAARMARHRREDAAPGEGAGHGEDGQRPAPTPPAPLTPSP